ncbi:MAG: HAD family hydrolase [Haloarculaceae archaeon]
MRDFAAVLFDLDDTLCRHEQDAQTVYYGAFEAAGIEPFGEPDELWAALSGPPAPDPDDRLAYLADGFGRVADGHGRSVDAGALAGGFVEVVDHSAVAFRDGAERALEAAGEHGPVGLLTNGPEHRQSTKLRSLGIGDAFDVVVFAGDMPRRKPHRDPFDRTVGDLGVDAARSLYVGDSLEYDVAGAKGAGLRAAWCPANGESDPGGYDPDYVLGSPADLVDVLDGPG